jgi:hypothetical protein
MTLFEKLEKNKKGGVRVEKVLGPDGEQIFKVKITSVCVAVGVKLLDSENSSTEYGYAKLEYQKKNKDYLFKISESSEALYGDERLWPFVLFFISDTYIVYAPWSWKEWVIYKPEQNLSDFFNQIFEIHKEMNNSNEHQIERGVDTTKSINDYKSNLEFISKKLIDIEIKCDEYKNDLTTAEKAISSLEKEIHKLENAAIIREKEIQYLSVTAKKYLFSKLSIHQLNNLINRPEHELRVDLQLFEPSIVLEYRTKKRVEWDSAGDWIQIPSTSFLLIDINGTVTALDETAISANPNFLGWYGTYLELHIIGSILITKNELLSKIS